MYFITLFGAVFLAFLSEYCSNRENDKIVLNKYFIVLLIIFLACISGLRTNPVFQSDEWNYRYAFNLLIDKPLDLTRVLHMEGGFYLFNWVLANTLKNNQCLIIFSALITNSLIIYFLAKESRYFIFSVYIYISGCFFYTSMNIIRQYIAIPIVLIGYTYLKKKKNLSFILLVFLASMFHVSSLILLPASFFIKKKGSPLSRFILFVFFLIIMINFDKVLTYLVSGTSYGHYLDNFNSENSYGVGLIRILFIIVPNLFIILNTHRINYLQNENHIYVNIIIISLCITLLSYYYVFFARLNEFFGIISTLIIPEISNAFMKDSRKIVTTAIVLLYFLFGLYQYSIN